ncbi:MAG: hypothetical protein RIB98_00550 [Acidimicrobiales bacterium]
MNSAEQDAAEQVDETVTTTDGDGEGLRATYPPEKPVGVEDPAIVQGDSEARDDVVTRAWREEPDETPGRGAPPEVPPPHREPPDGVPETEIVPRPETEVVPRPETEVVPDDEPESPSPE